MSRYAVLDYYNTVTCDTLAEACRVAEEWHPENWNVRLDPSMSLDNLNHKLSEAMGGEGAPVIEERDE